MFGKKIMTKGFYHVQMAGITGGDKYLASLCTKCGKCVPQCPQKIDIPKEMINVKKSLEGFFINLLMQFVGKMMKKQNK
jgi:hypothetical protein